MRGRKAVAVAGERHNVVAGHVNHVLSLPELPSQDASSCVKRVQPREAEQILRLGTRKLASCIRFAPSESEGLAHRPKFSLLHEGEIHLQSARKEKYTIDPCPGADIVVVQRPARVHP